MAIKVDTLKRKVGLLIRLTVFVGTNMQMNSHHLYNMTYVTVQLYGTLARAEGQLCRYLGEHWTSTLKTYIRTVLTLNE